MRVLISDLTKHLGVAPDAPETTIRAALAAPVVGDEDRIMASMYARHFPELLPASSAPARPERDDLSVLARQARPVPGR